MRIKIVFQKEFVFHTHIPVMINHINYGGHVGNDSMLSILHEARLRWLHQWELNEMNTGDHTGLIMADSALQYKAEAFYGDLLEVSLYIDNITSVSFDIFYKISCNRNHEEINVLHAKTGMITFDYINRKICKIPASFLEKINS